MAAARSLAAPPPNGVPCLLSAAGVGDLAEIPAASGPGPLPPALAGSLVRLRTLCAHVDTSGASGGAGGGEETDGLPPDLVAVGLLGLPELDGLTGVADSGGLAAPSPDELEVGLALFAGGGSGFDGAAGATICGGNGGSEAEERVVDLNISVECVRDEGAMLSGAAGGDSGPRVKTSFAQLETSGEGCAAPPPPGVCTASDAFLADLSNLLTASW